MFYALVITNQSYSNHSSGSYCLLVWTVCRHFKTTSTSRLATLTAFTFVVCIVRNPTPTSKLWTTIRPIITNWLLLFPQEWREKSLLTLSAILWTSRGFSSLWASMASNGRITTPALLAIGRDLENPAANRPNKAEQLPAQSVIAVSSRYHQQLHKQILISLVRLPELTIRWNWAKEEIPLKETVGVSFWYRRVIFPNENGGSEYEQRPFTRKMKELVQSGCIPRGGMIKKLHSLEVLKEEKCFQLSPPLDSSWRGGKPIEVQRPKNR